MKKLSWLVSSMLALVVLALGLIYFVPGFDLYTVRSDSMHPVFKAGDAIVVVPVGFLGESIKVGSVITYNLGGETVTHRVVQMDEPGYVITKGDANKQPDAASVPLSNIAGVYFFKIPYAGFVTAFIHTRTGWLLAVLIPAVLLLGWIIMDILREALKPEGAVAAQVERVERREKVARPVKVVRSKNVIRSENGARSTQIIHATKADRRYYEAFKPKRTTNNPLFYIQ
jgi:signal peptidase